MKRQKYITQNIILTVISCYLEKIDFTSLSRMLYFVGNQSLQNKFQYFLVWQVMNVLPQRLYQKINICKIETV